MLRANLGTFPHKGATPNTCMLRKDGEAIFRSLVARIENIALGQSDGGRASEQRIESIDGARGIAEHAVDAHTKLFEGVQLLGGLQVFTLRQRFLFFADE